MPYKQTLNLHIYVYFLLDELFRLKLIDLLLSNDNVFLLSNVID